MEKGIERQRKYRKKEREVVKEKDIERREKQRK
jgi:hypothetical protein